MHPMVKEFLDQQAEEKGAVLNKKKRELLDELGLYEKVYSDSERRSKEYPEYEYDENGHTHYYRKEYFEISDEEYAELLKYSEYKGHYSPGNGIATVFKILAVIIFVIGFIVGIVMGNQAGGSGWENDFSLPVALACWAAGFISGMMFMGFGEIIQLLTEIKNK